MAHIMRYRFKDGLEEAVIATVMREVLTALDYIHRHSGIHRDVKVRPTRGWPRLCARSRVCV